MKQTTFSDVDVMIAWLTFMRDKLDKDEPNTIQMYDLVIKELEK